MSKKRPGIPSKRDPAYWRGRLFKNAYLYKGRRIEVPSWSVKIQLFGKRKSFTLACQDRAEAAGEACQIYQTIAQSGWEAVIDNRFNTVRDPRSVGSLLSPGSIPFDVKYWKGRLTHRKYPETHEREFAVRIEHARSSHYFPLGTADETAAAARAMTIYQAIVKKGWASANMQFARELSLAFRWQDNPLAWTYTTLHTRLEQAAPKLSGDRAARRPDHRVVVIEPDPGIRQALAACGNSQKGFRCEATFADIATALRALAHLRVDLLLANHDLPETAGGVSLEKLLHLRPELALLSYSVFEDADQLFKSTPGGSVVYMLNRTLPNRIFEPIEELAAGPTREQIASCVRKYFQRLSALLPSGPPFGNLAKLTPREHEILEFLSKGDLVKEVADRLGISAWTVQGHVKRIFEKLNVHTRTEAVIKYLHK